MPLGQLGKSKTIAIGCALLPPHQIDITDIRVIQCGCSFTVLQFGQGLDCTLRVSAILSEDRAKWPDICRLRGGSRFCSSNSTDAALQDGPHQAVLSLAAGLGLQGKNPAATRLQDGAQEWEQLRLDGGPRLLAIPELDGQRLRHEHP